MLEVLSDKVRFWTLEPTGWVHTVELAPDFVTVWVCSAQHETHPEMVGRESDVTEHDAGYFHADDVTYRWVEERYSGNDKRNWRQHFHFRQSPEDVLKDLGEKALGSLHPEIAAYLKARAPATKAPAASNTKAKPSRARAQQHS